MPRGLLPCVTGLGNSGDIRHVGDGVSELRIHYGPGYLIYLTKQGEAVRRHRKLSQRRHEN
jgi:putative component of toxin-antitoxin plasmid stabilization module